jgi:predicted dehydrogenase
MALEKLALVGARGHFNTPLRVLGQMKQIRVVGVCDGGPDDSAAPVLRWCKENGHDPRTFDNYKRMLDQTKPDAISVCGPFELHASMSLEAIERGIHVFVEKPIAITMEDLDKLRTAHQKQPKVHIAGMMNSRYDPGFYTAWHLVKQGQIGDVRLVNARKSYKLGNRPAYYHKRETYGGTIPWVGIHAIDWAMWMCPHAVKTIYATHTTRDNGNNGTMERAAHCTFGLADERTISVSIDVFRPASAPSHGDDWIRLVGTSGVIEARPGSVNLINETHDGKQPIPADSDRDVFKDFVEHIDGKRPGLIDAQQTFALTEVCLLARQSADERGIVIRLAEDKTLRFA